MKACKVLLRESVRQTDKAYTYGIPDDLEDKITEGSYVKVPFGFGNRKEIALVVKVLSDLSNLGFDKSKLKNVSELLDLYPVMKKDQLAMIEPLKSRLLCTSGEIISMMVPSAVGTVAKAKGTFADIVSEEAAKAELASGKMRSASQMNILEFLLAEGLSIVCEAESHEAFFWLGLKSQLSAQRRLESVEQEVVDQVFDQVLVAKDLVGSESADIQRDVAASFRLHLVERPSGIVGEDVDGPCRPSEGFTRYLPERVGAENGVDVLVVAGQFVDSRQFFPLHGCLL